MFSEGAQDKCVPAAKCDGVITASCCKEHIFFFFFKISFGLFVPLFQDRTWGRERGNDMQQRAPGGLEPRSAAVEDIASVYGAPALPTVPLGAPVFSNLINFQTL